MATIPGVTIFGNLGTISGQADTGSVVFQLVNFGGQTPRATGELISTQSRTILTDNDGNWTIDLIGNYQIQPPNTYYTLSILTKLTQAQVSIGAYRFDEPGVFDLSVLTPLDSDNMGNPLVFGGVNSVAGRKGDVLLYESDIQNLVGDLVALSGLTLMVNGNLVSATTINVNGVGV